MENKKEEFNLEEIKKKALEQFRSGKSLYGKDGAFGPMLKSFLEAALEGELDAHLDDSERQEGNRRNGKTSKTVQTFGGPIEIETSRDRNATFELDIVKKRETVLADTLETKIIGMYGLGMSLRDISAHLKETYDADISHATLSAITDRVIPAIKEWQASPLESVYCIVWLDAMHYKVKDEIDSQKTSPLGEIVFCRTVQVVLRFHDNLSVDKGKGYIHPPIGKPDQL